MDNLFRAVVEEKVSKDGIDALSNDTMIRSLINETEVLLTGKKMHVTYKDAEEAIIYELNGDLSLKFPIIGTLKENDARKDYLSNYQRNNIKRIRINCNINTDADILQWIAKQTNVQGTLKSLIRKQIAEETKNEE